MTEKASNSHAAPTESEAKGKTMLLVEPVNGKVHFSFIVLYFVRTHPYLANSFVYS